MFICVYVYMYVCMNVYLLNMPHAYNDTIHKTIGYNKI